MATVQFSKGWLQLYQKRTLGSVASLLAATYQINPGRNHKLWNIVSSERYILHMQVLLEWCCSNVATYRWKVHNRKIEIICCRKVSFLTDLQCRFRGVSQGMKQTYLCLWYPLFQAQLRSTKSPNLELFSADDIKIYVAMTST